MAAHIISDEGIGVTGSNTEMFYLLEEHGYLSRDITEKMGKAVGFRNIIVHEYAKIELDQILEIAQQDIQDLNEYLISIFGKLGLSQ